MSLLSSFKRKVYKMTKFNIENFASQYGASFNKADLKVGKKEYKPVTVKQMKEKLVTRIDDAIKELEAFDGWKAKIKDAQFKNPTITRVLGGLTIKLSHGSRGEHIGIAPIHFAINNNTNQYNEALACLKAMKTAAEADEFNPMLEAKLKSYQARAEVGKLARKAQKKAEQSHLQVA